MVRALTDHHTPGDAQDVLARFITEGHLLRHLRRMRELYPQRQQVLIDALAKASHGQLLLQPSEQGMHLLHELPIGTDDQALSAQAQAAGSCWPRCRATPWSPNAGAGCLVMRGMTRWHCARRRQLLANCCAINSALGNIHGG